MPSAEEDRELGLRSLGDMPADQLAGPRSVEASLIAHVKPEEAAPEEVPEEVQEEVPEEVAEERPVSGVSPMDKMPTLALVPEPVAPMSLEPAAIGPSVSHTEKPKVTRKEKAVLLRRKINAAVGMVVLPVLIVGSTAAALMLSGSQYRYLPLLITGLIINGLLILLILESSMDGVLRLGLGLWLLWGTWWNFVVTMAYFHVTVPTFHINNSGVSGLSDLKGELITSTIVVILTSLALLLVVKNSSLVGRFTKLVLGVWIIWGVLNGAVVLAALLGTTFSNEPVLKVNPLLSATFSTTSHNAAPSVAVLMRNTFRLQANTVCRTGTAELKKELRSQHAPQARTGLALVSVQDVTSRELTRLEKLKPPTQDLTAYRGFLAGLRRQTTLELEMIAASGKGDRATYNQLAPLAIRYQLMARRAAAGLGLGACAAKDA